MQKTLIAEDIERIADVLGIEARYEADHWTLLLDSPEHQRHIRVEIYPDISIGKDTGSLVSVYTHNSHLQLHFVSGYVVSTLLGEVTFIAEREGWVSGLTVEREAACSLYANVDNSVLSGDFTRLGPEVMLSGIALCLTDENSDLLEEDDENIC